MTLPVVAIICIVCLVLEGFFSGSEMALVNADKMTLEREARRGSKGARLAINMLKSPASFFSTTLLGTNISTVTSSVVITLYIIYNWGEAYAPLAILWWPFMLVFGEIVPKSLYQHYADELVPKIAPVLTVWSYMTAPVGWILTRLSSRLMKSLRTISHVNVRLNRDELEHVLEHGTTNESDVRIEERVMISRIFDLSEKRVENIMTPLVDVVSAPITSSREEIEDIMETSTYSKIPIYDRESYDIIGTISCSKLLFADKGLGVKEMLRAPFYIPEEMPLDELLNTMRKKGESMAIVVDEYGGAVGVVTIEDLLEEVVGDIRDEHDKSSHPYKRLSASHYMVKGRMEIEEANARLGLSIPDGDYETVAGFIIFRLERIPKSGEEFEHGRWRFIIKKATPRAILEIEVKRITK